MKKERRWLGSPTWTAIVAALALAGCGGSSEEENYPVMFQQYGGAGSYPASALNLATFDQQFAAVDGYAWKNSCDGVIRVLSQEGGSWTGRVERGVRSWGIRERCHSSGEIAGEVGMDGSLHFTLTQERWPSADIVATPTTPEHRIDCTALGPGRYSGHLDRNRFYAVGTIPVLCDDGREATITEVMQGSYPAPEGSHDT
jgi:hypothetical protein